MLQLLLVCAHVLASVFLVGFALFGLILSLAGTSDELRQRAYTSLWPPEGLPVPVRVRVVGLGWFALAACLVTGAPAFALRGPPAMGGGYLFKFAAIALAGLALLLITARPRPAVLRAFFVAVVLVVAISATLAR